MTTPPLLWPADWPNNYVNRIVGRFERAIPLFELSLQHDLELREARAALGFERGDTAFAMTLEKIRDALRGRLEEYPLAALLSQTADENDATYEALLGLTVACSLILLNRNSNNDSKVKLACDAVRLMGKKREFSTLDLFTGNINLEQFLATAFDGEHYGTCNADVLRCQFIYSLLFAVKTGKDAKNRGVQHAPEGGEGYQTSTSKALDIDSDDDGVSSVIIKQSTTGQHSHNVELEPGHREYSVAPSGRPEEFTNLPLQQYRQTQHVEAWLKRRMALPTQFGGFTRQEIHKVLNVCLDEPSTPSRAIIIGTLLTGMRPDALIELLRNPNNRSSGRWISQENGQTFFCAALDLPQNRKHVEPIGLKLLTQVQHLRIGIPMELAERLNEIDMDTLTVEQVEQDFAQLWAHSGRKQTIVRLASVLRDRLTVLGEDASIAGLIYGETAQNLPALYYATHDLDRVNEAYQRAISSFDGNKTWTFGPSNGGHCGSQIYVLEDRVQKFFIIANDEIDFLREKWKRNRSPHNLTQFHNLFAALTLFSLMLLTGHRPVNNPFDRLSDFDLDRRLLFISDKEVRYSPAGRFVPLAGKAVDQLEAWCSHIERLRAIENDVDSELTVKCKEALSSEGPLIFTLGDAKLTGLGPPHDVRCGALREIWNDNIWPLPLNWGRHLQRRLLLRVRSELADAFMGHADPGAEAHAVHSGLNFHDLKELREALDGIANDLGVVTFKGLSG